MARPRHRAGDQRVAIRGERPLTRATPPNLGSTRQLASREIFAMRFNFSMLPAAASIAVGVLLASALPAAAVVDTVMRDPSGKAHRALDITRVEVSHTQRAV